MKPSVTQQDITGLGTILCVGAHPDDETFMAGGLLAAAAANGQTVICVTATKGEAGSQDPVKYPVERMGEVRTEELAAALKILGVQEHHWLGYLDGECTQVDPGEATLRLQQIIEKYQPNTVLTFGSDGLTGHPDHQAVSSWVTTALGQSELSPELFYAVLTTDQYQKYLQTIHTSLNFFYNIKQPPVYADQDCGILFTSNDQQCAKKQAAFAAMPSQYSAMFAAFDESFLTEAFRVEAFVRADSK
ncbi:PIG-L family deacetylase [Candidatus Saccharibacteria bacterium]|nr:MAG: PIG-L family deacetylase [Candidatus Saccharibacteria bacterium]